MKCEEALTKIEAYIDHTLSGRELEEFLEHVKSCRECYDELETYYIISVGMRYLEEENLEAAFRAAHTLKGVAQNMGFDNLAESSSVLTEALRSRKVMPYAEQIEKVCEDYNKIREIITEYKK